MCISFKSDKCKLVRVLFFFTSQCIHTDCWRKQRKIKKKPVKINPLFNNLILIRLIFFYSHSQITNAQDLAYANHLCCKSQSHRRPNKNYSILNRNQCIEHKIKIYAIAKKNSKHVVSTDFYIYIKTVPDQYRKIVHTKKIYAKHHAISSH